MTCFTYYYNVLRIIILLGSLSYESRIIRYQFILDTYIKKEPAKIEQYNNIN